MISLLIENRRRGAEEQSNDSDDSWDTMPLKQRPCQGAEGREDASVRSRELPTTSSDFWRDSPYMVNDGIMFAGEENEPCFRKVSKLFAAMENWDNVNEEQQLEVLRRVKEWHRTCLLPEETAPSTISEAVHLLSEFRSHSESRFVSHTLKTNHLLFF